jgi:hypothetical protein
MYSVEMIAKVQERKPFLDADSLKFRTTLTLLGRYSGFFSNQMDPRHEGGGVGWLLLRKTGKRYLAGKI